MKSRSRSRRGRAPAPTQLPPWWTPSTAQARPRVPSRPAPSAPPEAPGNRPERATRYRDEPPPGPPQSRTPHPDEYSDVHSDDHPDDYADGCHREAGLGEPDLPADDLLTHGAEPPADLYPPEPPPASEQSRQPLPGGRWTDGDADSGSDIWIPAARPETPAATAGTAAAGTGATRATPSAGAELAASRPTDGDSRRVRTSVDRPVSSLRPVSIDEARQLAECFALDYMSCDEDDPQLRQLALAPYLSRRSDALLGWPTERAGVGRQRAIASRAGECLAQGRWVTVDVSVLVEIYQRDGSRPADESEHTDPAAQRPELPPDARWSAVPPAHAPGWVCSMTVWHRLGIPIRRHDSGGLVVELFTVSEPES